MTSKTSKGGRPPVDSERVDVRIQRELLDKLDNWRKSQADDPSRPEAVRRLIDEALGKEGQT